jgi:lysophospholipase L1-like esterase
VANQYDPMLPVPNEALLVAALNDVISNVVQYFPNNVVLVDVFSDFQGRSGLLLIERKGAGFQVHPTNAGYDVMAKAFADAIRSK